MFAPHGQIRVKHDNRVEHYNKVEHDRIDEMINGALTVQGGMEPEQYIDVAPNKEGRRLYDHTEESSHPLCEGNMNIEGFIK